MVNFHWTKRGPYKRARVYMRVELNESGENSVGHTVDLDRISSVIQLNNL